MKKLIAAAAALVLVGSLVAAGCRPADDDCDARGLGIELTAAQAGKGGGGSRGSSRSGGSRSTGRSPSLSKSPKKSGSHGTNHGSSRRHQTTTGSTATTTDHPPAGRDRRSTATARPGARPSERAAPGPTPTQQRKGGAVKGFRKFMVGLAAGLIVWAGTAYIPVIGPWASVLGLAAALVLWA